MKTLPIIICFFAVALASGIASDAKRINGEILEFGTYEVVEPRPDLQVPSPSGGQQPPVHIAKTIKFRVHTNRIHAIKGTSFGFRYRLTNMPNALVALEVETRHPEFTLPNGKKDSGRVLEIQVEPKDGVWTHHVGYRFDEAFELVEGEWTFTLYHEKQKLLTRTFRVVRR